MDCGTVPVHGRLTVAATKTLVGALTARRYEVPMLTMVA
jgi:hypothetical protein